MLERLSNLGYFLRTSSGSRRGVVVCAEDTPPRARVALGLTCAEGLPGTVKGLKIVMGVGVTDTGE